MKTAAQRAAKRLRRELRQQAVGMSDTAHPIAPPGPAKFHRFYLRTREKADEMAAGLTGRGRETRIVERTGALPWQVMLRANENEMRDPGLYVYQYQEFAGMFGGEYGGML